jgi:glycosyltransferase involved in cell wall biosynthesis
MVIGIDASRANLTQRTGTEWYSYHVIQGLKKLIPPEHQVVLYSKEPLQGELAVLPAQWSSHVLRWPPKLLWTQLRLSWEMLRHRPDVLYISAHTTPVIAPRRTVSVIHDVGFMRQHSLYSGFAERNYHRFALWLATKKSQRIITVSQFSQGEIHAVTGIPLKEIRVIPNGLNQRALPADVSVVLRQYHIQQPYLLYVGRLEEKKNILRLIEAFALLRSQNGFTGQLVLAGGKGFGYDRILQRIVDLGIRDAVVETGWTSETDIAALMQQARVFVFPSLYEGFGIPVLEAMHLGTPVACSAIPALREVAGDAARLFDPHIPEQIATTIHHLLTSEAQSDYRQRGRERAAQFSWARTAKETWNVLESLL